MAQPLTPLQTDALAALRQHGRLVRHTSGSWTSPNEAHETHTRGELAPRWCFRHSTVMCLVLRGYADGADFSDDGQPGALIPISA